MDQGNYSYASEAALSVASSGRRALGGPVSRGGIYQVVEKGEPEMVRYGDKSYLLSPGDGQVSPMSSGQGGSPSLNVTINTNVAPGTDAATLRSAMAEATRNAVAAVRNSMYSGGWASR